MGGRTVHHTSTKNFEKLRKNYEFFTKGEVTLWWVAVSLISDLEEALSLLCVLSFFYSLLILADIGNMPSTVLILLTLGYQLAVLVLGIGLLYNYGGVKQFFPSLFDISIYISGALVFAFLGVSRGIVK